MPVRLPRRRPPLAIRWLAPTAAIALAAACPVSAQAASPDTTVNGPWVTTSTTPTYSLASTEPGSTFECSVNYGAWKLCASPTTVTAAVGGNSVRARAINAAGEVDATPAIKYTMVDRTPPSASVDGLTDGASLSAATALTVTGTDSYAMGKIEIWVDSVSRGIKDFSTNPKSGSLAVTIDPTRLTGVQHTLKLRVADRAGNTLEKVLGFTTPPKQVFGPASFWNTPLSATAE